MERFFLTAQRQWGREAQALIDAGRLATLQDCQQFLAAWLHSEYNARVHSSTHETPVARLSHVHPEHPIVWVDPQTLADAFLWTETRSVTAVATISIEGHDFEVAPELARRKITVAYDPYDLTRVLVHCDGHSYGTATPLGPLPAHSKHVRAPEPPARPPDERTALHDLLERHDQQQRLHEAGRTRFDVPAGGSTP